MLLEIDGIFIQIFMQYSVNASSNISQKWMPASQGRDYSFYSEMLSRLDGATAGIENHDGCFDIFREFHGVVLGAGSLPFVGHNL